MLVDIVNRYSREMLRARPNDLFLFGDNMERVGLGGQAGACRGEPNAVGLPTLWAPGFYFRDSDFPVAREAIDEALTALRRHLLAGGTIVLPAHGVGTGIAQLPERAPKIHQYISEALKTLTEKGV